MLTGSVRFHAALAAAALVALPWLGGHQSTGHQSAAPAPQRAAGGPVSRARAGPGPGAAVQVRADEQAQLKSINAPAAWRVSQGREVTVGVLDTGVDASAADLSGSVSTGPDYTQGANPPGYQPPHLHGTFIASLIAGHGNGPGRADGVIGVAPAARVLSVRVILDDQEPGVGPYNTNPRFANAIGRGIRYAASHGAAVINMSLGSVQPTSAMQAALAYAVSRGVVVVASAGNSGAPGQAYTPYSYPASFAGVLSVAAVDQTGALRSRRRGDRSRARRDLPAGQRDQPGGGLRDRGRRPDPVRVPAALPGPGGTGDDQLSRAPPGGRLQPGHRIR